MNVLIGTCIGGYIAIFFERPIICICIHVVAIKMKFYFLILFVASIPLFIY